MNIKQPPKPRTDREIMIDNIKQITSLALRIPKFHYSQSIEFDGKHIEINITISSDEAKS